MCTSSTIIFYICYRIIHGIFGFVGFGNPFLGLVWSLFGQCRRCFCGAIDIVDVLSCIAWVLVVGGFDNNNNNACSAV